MPTLAHAPIVGRRAGPWRAERRRCGPRMTKAAMRTYNRPNLRFRPPFPANRKGDGARSTSLRAYPSSPSRRKLRGNRKRAWVRPPSSRPLQFANHPALVCSWTAVPLLLLFRMTVSWSETDAKRRALAPRSRRPHGGRVQRSNAMSLRVKPRITSGTCGSRKNSTTSSRNGPPISVKRSRPRRGRSSTGSEAPKSMNK